MFWITISPEYRLQWILLLLNFFLFLMTNVNSGDIDGRVPVTATKYSINALHFPIKKEWRLWFHGRQVIFETPILNYNIYHGYQCKPKI